MVSDKQLAERALAMREHAYAPYSTFLVGCALVADGDIYAGANVENASYGACVCAERTAVNLAVISGARHIERVAVATQASPPAVPCGICLQSIREFSENPSRVRILLINPIGEWCEFTLAELLPQGFGGSQLVEATRESKSAALAKPSSTES